MCTKVQSARLPHCCFFTLEHVSSPEDLDETVGPPHCRPSWCRPASMFPCQGINPMATALPLQVLNARLECLLITRLVGRTFSGRMVLRNAKEERSSTDASMDDLILLALDSGAPLLVHKDVSR